MTYLVDTSALVRIMRDQADQKWREAASRGVIAVCEPVLTEMLTGVDATDYTTTEDDVRGTYPYITVPDDIWDQARSIQRELAAHSAHQGPSVIDLVIASTAIRCQLTVLHEDRDYKTVARFLPDLKQKRISEGSQ